MKEKEKALEKSFSARRLKLKEHAVRKAMKLVLSRKRKMLKLPPSLVPAAVFYNSKRLRKLFFNNLNFSQLLKVQKATKWSFQNLGFQTKIKQDKQDNPEGVHA